jgi:hypothetical protein
MRRIMPVGLISTAVMLFVVMPAGASGINPLSQPISTADPGVALFEGELIDLAEGWGLARACMVWRSVDVVECFRSEELMAAREAQILRELEPGLPGSGGTASASWYCSSPLRLYEHASFGGRQLAFWDGGYWQNLTNWGFNDATSSFKTGSCYSYMAEHIWGGGAWYYGNTSPYTWTYYVGSEWNDRVSSIYNR